jgi:hypothetical protein
MYFWTICRKITLKEVEQFNLNMVCIEIKQFTIYKDEIDFKWSFKWLILKLIL